MVNHLDEDDDKIQINLQKCKLQPLFRLGQGCFGTTFRYTSESGRNYVVKFIKYSFLDNIRFTEWDCMLRIYRLLHSVMPNHIINPILTWNCRVEDIPKHIKPLLDLEDSYDSDVIRKYKIMLFDKLGDCNLCEFIKKPRSKKVKCEIILQLLIYMVYFKLKTSLSHGDVHAENVIVKKNIDECEMTYFNGLCYRFTPEYLVYPIDFGKCFEDKPGRTYDNEQDFTRLWMRIFVWIFDDEYFLKFTHQQKEELKTLEGNKMYLENNLNDGIFSSLVKVSY
jgi:hypothetical protein